LNCDRRATALGLRAAVWLLRRLADQRWLAVRRDAIGMDRRPDLLLLRTRSRLATLAVRMRHKRHAEALGRRRVAERYTGKLLEELEQVLAQDVGE
jgi:hypothetical protein